MAKRNKVLTVVITVLLASVLGVLGREIVKTGEKKVGITRHNERPSPSELAGLIVAMNEAAMKPGHRFTNGVIFDRARASGETVVYSYHVEMLRDEVSPDWLSELQATLPQEYCEQMSAMAEGGVSARWCYTDSEGAEIICITSTPADCGTGASFPAD